MLERAAELPAHASFLRAVAAHGLPLGADGAAVLRDQHVVPVVFRLCGMEVDERRDLVLEHPLVDRHRVVRGVELHPLRMEVWAERLELRECLDERAPVVPRSRKEQWKERQVALRVGGCEEVQVVAAVVAVPRGIPSDETIRLGVGAVAVAMLDALLVAVAYAVRTFAMRRHDRRAVARDAEMLLRDEAAFRRTLEEQEEQAEEAAVRLGILRNVPAPFLDVGFDGFIKPYGRMIRVAWQCLL